MLAMVHFLFSRSCLRRILTWSCVYTVMSLCIILTWTAICGVNIREFQAEWLAALSIPLLISVRLWVSLPLVASFSVASRATLAKYIPTILFGSAVGFLINHVLRFGGEAALHVCMASSIAVFCKLEYYFYPRRWSNFLLPPARPNILRELTSSMKLSISVSIFNAPPIGIFILAYRKILLYIMWGSHFSAPQSSACILLAVVKNAATILKAPVISYLATEDMCNSSSYQPDLHSYKVFLLATAVAALLLTLLEVATASFVVFMAYPMDFSKLIDCFADSLSSRSASIRERSINHSMANIRSGKSCEPRRDEQQLLYEAVSIGGAHYNGPSFRWRVQTDEGSSTLKLPPAQLPEGRFLSAVPSTRTYLNEAGMENRFSQNSQGSVALTSSIKATGDVSQQSSVGAISHGGTSLRRALAGTPPWLDVIHRQREFSDMLLTSVKPRQWGVPVLPFLSGMQVTRVELFCRCLALQDLARLARTSVKRRRQLFEADGKWFEISFALCALVDAVTIQLQLCVAHGLQEVIEPSLGIDSSETIDSKTSAHIPSALAATLTIARSSSLVKAQMAHLLIQGGRAADKGPLAQNWDGTVSWAAVDIVKESRKRRSGTLQGRFLAWLMKRKVIKFVPAVVKSLVFGMTTKIDPDPLSASLAQAVVHAVEALSLLLLAALREDPSGTAQHHAGSILCSLMGLELAVKEHEDLMRRALALNALDTSRAQQPPAGGVRCKISTDKGYHRLHRSEVPQLFSPHLQAVSMATEEAIRRIIRGYRDVLVTYSFPKLYAATLQAKLASK